MVYRFGTEERNRDVARLRAIGLYTNKQIAKALNIDNSTVSHIYNERATIPTNPVMSFEEAALMENVNIHVIKSLVTGRHLRVVQDRSGFGNDIQGVLITLGIKMNDARGIGEEWISVDDAADLAGMLRPRGMYNRALKDQVVSIKAPRGHAFHVGDQKGLKILVKKDSIKPARRQPKRKPISVTKDPQLPRFTMVISSDASKKPIVIHGRQITITTLYDDRRETKLREVLKTDIDMLPGNRPQVKTRTYTQ